MVIIVSEETGKVTVAYDGNLTRNIDGNELREKLAKLKKDVNQESKKFKIWKGKHREHEEDADE